MITIGIDPSINCTGVCVYDTEKHTHKYYMIVGSCTKKMKSFKNDYINILNYEKETPVGDYSEKEYIKTKNFQRIGIFINDIIKLHNPDVIQMEGISYGSRGSSALADLAGLNFFIRSIIVENNIPFNIIAPTGVKKFAVGNGGVEKDVIIASWKKLDSNISNITEIKLDDLADSYFIAHYKNQDDIN